MAGILWAFGSAFGDEFYKQSFGIFISNAYFIASVFVKDDI